MRSQGDSTCSGPYDTTDIPFQMELRAGGARDLQYVSLASDDPTRETCVQDFVVDDDTASIAGGQNCTFDVKSVDPETGEEVVLGTLLQTYIQDVLELSGDSLHERGVMEYDSGDGICRDTFELDFVRVD